MIKYEKTELFSHPGIVVRRSTVDTEGWGVFTTVDLEENEIIQETPYLVFDSNEVDDGSNVITYSYGMYEDYASIPFGYGPLFNHHPKKVNCTQAYNEHYRYMTFFTTEPVKAGSELFLDYGCGERIFVSPMSN